MNNLRWLNFGELCQILKFKISWAQGLKSARSLSLLLMIFLLLLSALIASISSQPRYVSYIDQLKQWWPVDGLAAGLGVPS